MTLIHYDYKHNISSVESIQIWGNRLLIDLLVFFGQFKGNWIKAGLRYTSCFKTVIIKFQETVINKRGINF